MQNRSDTSRLDKTHIGYLKNKLYLQISINLGAENCCRQINV
jgi:hypothetical protein